MQVVDKRRKAEFASLLRGDVFQAESGIFYLKTDDRDEAVILQTGRKNLFSPDESVTLVKGYFVVEGDL